MREQHLLQAETKCSYYRQPTIPEGRKENAIKLSLQRNVFILNMVWRPNPYRYCTVKLASDKTNKKSRFLPCVAQQYKIQTSLNDNVWDDNQRQPAKWQPTQLNLSWHI